jgi:hypothetical protein
MDGTKLVSGWSVGLWGIESIMAPGPRCFIPLTNMLLCVPSLQEVCCWVGCIDVPFPDFCDREAWTMVDTELDPRNIPLLGVCFGTRDPPEPPKATQADSISLVQSNRDLFVSWDACESHTAAVEEYSVCVETRSGEGATGEPDVFFSWGTLSVSRVTGSQPELQVLTLPHSAMFGPISPTLARPGTEGAANVVPCTPQGSARHASFPSALAGLTTGASIRARVLCVTVDGGRAQSASHPFLVVRTYIAFFKVSCSRQPHPENST